MSREYKVSSIHQADDAINHLNQKVYQAKRQLADDIARAQERATREAEQTSRTLIQQERNRMLNTLDREISGVNTSIRNLDNAHRQRLQNTARQLETLIDKETDSVRRETRQGLESLKGRLSSLASSTQQQINNTNTRIDAVNSLSKARFETVQRRVTELSKDTMRRFDEQQQQLNSHQTQLDSHQHQLNSHQHQLNSLTTTVNGILDRFNSENQKRKEAVEMARAIYEATFKRTDIDRFNPDEAHRVHDRMNRLMTDANSSTATNQAIEAIMNIQWAEEVAVKRKIIYDAILAQALESLETVLTEVNSNREVTVANPENKNDTINIEVDFWNRGEYDEIKKKLEILKTELNAQPSTERIHEITAEVAELEVKATDMVGKAAERSILSENRVIITEDIITALQEQGWQIERTSDGNDEIGYEGGEVDSDWREGVYVYLRSMRGERIVIRVTPTTDNRDNEIAFHRVDNRSLTSNEFMRSLQTLKAQIEKSGHKLGDIHAPKGDGGDARLSEITSSAKLGKKGAAQSIRRKMRGA